MAIKAVGSQGTKLKIKVANAFVAVGGLKDFSGIGGGSASVIDVTDLDSLAKEKLAGLADEGQATFNFNYIPTDAGQIAIEAARLAGEAALFQVVLKSGTSFDFEGFVLTAEKSAGVDAVVALAVSVEITGAVTKGTVTP